MLSVQDPVIPIVGEIARCHPGCISLGQGVVYYPPPPQALEQIARFLQDPANHKYRPVRGIPELLQALEVKLAAENGIPPDECGIVVTAGSNMGFAAVIHAVTDPGDEVILQSPYYFNHHMAVALAGCRPVVVPTDSRYHPDPDRVREAITPRTRAVVTVSPNNPTGAVYSEAELREVNALCERHGILHVHDEAYEYFTYDDAAHYSPGGATGASGHTISLFSLSKSHGFASWRIGWMATPRRLLPAIDKILDTLLICPPVISQYAAVGALAAGRAYCLERLQPLKEARLYACRSFRELGEICEAPEARGAFYFLIRLRTQLPDMTIVERLIREHGVAVMPGSAFGFTDGCAIRVAYGALDRDTVEEGIGRLVKGLRSLLSGGA